MEGLNIVRARISELEELVPLMDEYRVFYKQSPDPDAARSFLHSRMIKQESVIFLAYYNKVPAGFTQLYTSFSSVSLQPIFILNDLFVHKEYRNRGVGAALLLKAQEFCKEIGYKGLALETATDNPAQHLYERLGWERDSHCFHYFWKP
ncbi:MAG: GNAT family N-acetyltransferase [Flavobacteriaceae bacterium]|nr:GNAT family N-acetyltransferase [Flavobacteriaceae bacterium]